MDRELQAFIEAWRIAAPELEAMRTRALREVDVPAALDQLSGMVDSAVFLEQLDDSRGIIEMQRIFARLRR
ncbi:MAG: hypothetical protein JNJ74_04555 [Xanthomonadales bacterium]|nr:hypothetical protein [Xanthomonadales bacterium]